MGIGELLHSACHSNAIKLTNTGRPYFLRSVYLVNQCRALQLYCKERKFPEKDLAGFVIFCTCWLILLMSYLVF